MGPAGSRSPAQLSDICPGPWGAAWWIGASLFYFFLFFASRGHHPLGRVKFRLQLIPYYLAANQSASRLLISTLKYWQNAISGR